MNTVSMMDSYVPLKQLGGFLITASGRDHKNFAIYRGIFLATFCYIYSHSSKSINQLRIK